LAGHNRAPSRVDQLRKILYNLLPLFIPAKKNMFQSQRLIIILSWRPKSRGANCLQPHEGIDRIQQKRLTVSLEMSNGSRHSRKMVEVLGMDSATLYCLSMRDHRTVTPIPFLLYPLQLPLRVSHKTPLSFLRMTIISTIASRLIPHLTTGSFQKAQTANQLLIPRHIFLTSIIMVSRPLANQYL